jgi:hypothetical protein
MDASMRMAERKAGNRKVKHLSLKKCLSDE